MKKNLIFLLNSPYPDYTGGRETWIYNVCNRLINDYNITIMTQKKDVDQGGMGKFTDIDERINIIKISTLSSYKGVCKLVHSYIRFLNKYILACRMYKALLKYIIPEEKYILISMDTVFMGYAVRKVCEKHPNCIHIASVRCPHAEMYAEDYPILQQLIMKMENQNLNSAIDIWANGTDTADMLRQKGFQSIVIKNGVNIKKISNAQFLDLHELLNIPKDEEIIVTVGTIEDIKGYKELIKALGILKYHYNKRAHLIGVGKGPTEKYIKLSIAESVPELVHFVGEKKNAIEYAKSSDIIACLSGGSGLGMACLEAMCSMKPIIAWDSNVYTQMIENKKSGLLVKQWDVLALAEGINYILENYQECMKWTIEASMRVRQFDWNYVVMDISERVESIN